MLVLLQYRCNYEHMQKKKYLLIHGEDDFGQIVNWQDVTK